MCLGEDRVAFQHFAVPALAASDWLDVNPAVAKALVLVDSMHTIRPVAQLVVRYRIKERWYVFLAHVDGLLSVGGLCSNYLKRLFEEGRVIIGGKREGINRIKIKCNESRILSW